MRASSWMPSRDQPCNCQRASRRKTLRGTILIAASRSAVTTGFCNALILHIWRERLAMRRVRGWRACAFRRHGGAQRGMQCWAPDEDARHSRHGFVPADIVRHQDLAVGSQDRHPVDGVALCLDVFRRSERRKGTHGVGKHRDARADVIEALGALEERYLCAVPGQCRGRGQATDSAADHGDMKCVRHALPASRDNESSAKGTALSLCSGAIGAAWIYLEWTASTARTPRYSGVAIAVMVESLTEDGCASGFVLPT